MSSEPRPPETVAPRSALRQFLAPRWWIAHLLLVVVGVVMIALGRWQWHVAGVKHGDLRNYAYALQWWAFTAFAVFFWIRLMRDARREVADVEITEADEAAASTRPADVDPNPADGRSEPGAGRKHAADYRRYTMPTSAENTEPTGDPVVDEYNRYLRALAGKPGATTDKASEESTR